MVEAEVVVALMMMSFVVVVGVVVVAVETMPVVVEVVALGEREIDCFNTDG